jgi:hypothetical protein
MAGEGGPNGARRKAQGVRRRCRMAVARCRMLDARSDEAYGVDRLESGWCKAEWQARGPFYVLCSKVTKIGLETKAPCPRASIL